MEKKHYLCIVTLVLLTLFSCGEKPEPAALTTVDSLLDRHKVVPAEPQLKAFAKDTAQASEHVKMYYALLQLKLQDKKYVPLRDLAKAQSIAHYFHSHGKKATGTILVLRRLYLS